ncbi:protein of unknown function [Desulfotomaculum arcticum]|uniref:DUF4367 domain-containing protein n=1 Tax=Desulfotruncus arcticus DSM 17038 TaxID=1121424 RepID=A0A1I2Z0S8_9FIRM|nr:DUF4367 domain-containing protein [Desulfotruncus arcticus]SFH31492.1 protein of unknown function [Desulfotomaculum arcticum] [Desulfotruncus arcticus DSM 17038]
MDKRSTEPIPPNTNSDKEIFKKILSEKECDANVKDRMYAILYEASSADEATMDTDLIDECVKAIDLIEGHTEHLDPEKMKAMRQKVDQKYENWLKVQRKRRLKKLLAQSAAGFILVFFMSSAVASALGYNLVQTVVDWGKETFYLSAENESNGLNGNANIADRKIYGSIDEVLQDMPAKPLLPQWVPGGFVFKYAEKFVRLDNTNVMLYYENSAHKTIAFDFEIYTDQASADASFEKDDKMVEVYEKNNIPHYIFQNIDRVQAVWTSSNVIYNLSGDVSTDEMKKIIDSMNGGS